MKRFSFLLVLVALAAALSVPAWSQSPFTTKPEASSKAPAVLLKSPFFERITLWQYNLKQKMSQLIRVSRKEHNVGPLLLLVILAFAYGAVHAAGPGHGKVIAVSYVLSNRSTIPGGVLFGFLIAAVHGLSAVLGVLGLHFLIQRTVSQTLASVTEVTQMISFGLIVLLGLGILIKSGHAFFSPSKGDKGKRPGKGPGKKLVPWAIAVGLVPCPAVVMVMLFCISMDGMPLGLLLAASISLGMAATISLVITATIIGKTGLMNLSRKHMEKMENLMGLLSGAAIAGFGTLFLLAAISTALY